MLCQTGEPPVGQTATGFDRLLSALRPCLGQALKRQTKITIGKIRFLWNMGGYPMQEKDNELFKKQPTEQTEGQAVDQDGSTSCRNRDDIPVVCEQPTYAVAPLSLIHI